MVKMSNPVRVFNAEEQVRSIAFDNPEAAAQAVQALESIRNLTDRVEDLTDRVEDLEYDRAQIRPLPLMAIISTVSTAILGFYAREERNGAKVSNIISGIFGAALGVSLTAMGCMWRKMDSGY